MKRLLTIIALGVVLLIQGSVPVVAGGFAIGLATEFTQLLNHGQLLSQYIRQGLQLEEALKQTANMLENSQTLTSQVFGPIMNDINELASIVQGGRALAYSMANLNAQFQSRFPGYEYLAHDYFTNYRDWSQTSLDTSLATLRAAGMQGQQLQSEQSILAAVRSMAQTADGRMEALQVANQIAEQEVQQLMKLRELMLADLQSKQTYQASQVQKDAAAEAAVEQFFKYTRQSSSGNTYESGWR